MFQRTKNESVLRVFAATTAVLTGWLLFPREVFAKAPVRPQPVSRLAEKGLTQTPDAELRARIAAREAAKRKKAADRPAERTLTAKEMQDIFGRGPYRNKYFNGVLPWQRSLRDVNLCNGNLFKSFTDVQVAPGRGAGLVLQRTYNSNDERVGPFGVGWTHAYDIRMEETTETDPVTGDEVVTRCDFFGGKHRYTRDADGLYSPPAYLYDEMDSNYDEFMVNGPPEVVDDTQRGMDGTVKHFVPGGTDADGTPSASRVCDYIEDRFGNRTTLTYGMTATNPDGSTTKLLTEVKDPVNRTLTFTWVNYGTTQQPMWRITEVEGPLYEVQYQYYLNANDPASYGNLWKATQDPTGLNRTTTYSYTSVSGENGLLASISDPLGHAISYQYAVPTGVTDTVWVSQVSEPGSGGPHVWTLGVEPNPYFSGDALYVWAESNGGLAVGITVDASLRKHLLYPGRLTWSDGIGYMHQTEYDSQNNVVVVGDYARFDTSGGEYYSQQGVTGAAREYYSEYGPHGNVLSQKTGWSNPNPTTHSYYDASKYFQKASTTDAAGNTVTMDYYANDDPNPGNRGQVKWVRGPGYNTPSSPDYQKQYSYTYNAHGQKETETNPSGVVTQYTYGDSWGNLTQVVQDVGGLNRTTGMTYDAAGRIVSTTDPLGQTSNSSYNVLGQPTSASFPATSSTPAETISYAYGANGRLESVTNNRGTTSIGYETGNDLVASVTDPVTGTMSYTYGLAGQKLSTTLPDSQTWTYSYVDPSLFQGFGIDSYAYIVAGDDPNGVAFMPDTITDDEGRAVKCYFDQRGRLWDLITNQAYNQSGQPIQYLRSLHAHLWSSVDKGLLLETLTTTWHGPSAANNRILTRNHYTYNSREQRTANAVSTQPLDTNGYPALDGFGNPLLQTRTETYGYDENNRLDSVNYGDGQSQSYTFDALGNRLSKQDNVTGNEAYTYNAANMLLSRNSQNYVNDANGNTLTGGGRTNTWDSQNRLTRVVASSGLISDYVYGADGLRRRSVVTNIAGEKTQTDYVYDDQNVVAEVVRHFNSSGVQVGPADTVTYFQGPNGPVYRRVANNPDVRWYLYDGGGNVAGEVDVNGTPTATKKHDVYGLSRSVTGTPQSKHGWQGGVGHYSEDETGLIYMRARYYDPVTARFASQDPVRDGNNWFIYCNDDPVNKSDPTGKMEVGDWAWWSAVFKMVDEMSFVKGYAAQLLREWADAIELKGAKLRLSGAKLMAQGQMYDRIPEPEVRATGALMMKEASKQLGQAAVHYIVAQQLRTMAEFLGQGPSIGGWLE